MDSKSREYLDKLLTKTPETLNNEEIGFLRARYSYLNKSQRSEYDSVLNPKVETKPSVEPETVKDDGNSKQTN